VFFKKKLKSWLRTCGCLGNIRSENSLHDHTRSMRCDKPLGRNSCFKSSRVKRTCEVCGSVASTACRPATRQRV